MLIFFVAVISLFSSFDGLSSGRGDYWYCASIGHSKGSDRLMLPISGVFYNESVNYNNMIADFKRKVLEQTNNDFVLDVEPKCVDFDTGNDAEESRLLQIKIARESGFRPVAIEFSY